MAEKTFRNKIYWFTFLFSVLVIWVHSYNAVLFLGNTKSAASLVRLERFFGDRIAQIAVPGFFMISSYLFFRGYRPEILMRKWNSRIRSVLVPYIVWNSLYYFGYVIGSRLPYISDVIGKGKIPFGLPETVDAILNYTYNYVFWYLYQLILLILLAPLIYLAVKRVWPGIAFLAVLLAGVYLGIDLPLLNLDALFYYSFAAFAAVHGKAVVEGVWMIAGCISLGTDLPGSSLGEAASVTVVYRLLVPVGLWLTVPEERLFEARDFMKNNFFLYAVHFALVRLINKTGALLLPPVPVLAFLLFFFMPLFAVVLSWLAGGLIRRLMPAVWRLLNGGR